MIRSSAPAAAPVVDAVAQPIGTIDECRGAARRRRLHEEFQRLVAPEAGQYEIPAVGSGAAAVP
jgi:hypothetical protein